VFGLECGEGGRDVNGDISAEMHSSRLSDRSEGRGDAPNEKLALNMLTGVCARLSAVTVPRSVRDPGLLIVERSRNVERVIYSEYKYNVDFEFRRSADLCHWYIVLT
jgi:hypothetical protein